MKEMVVENQSCDGVQDTWERKEAGEEKDETITVKVLEGWQ